MRGPGLFFVANPATPSRTITILSPKPQRLKPNLLSLPAPNPGLTHWAFLFVIIRLPMERALDAPTIVRARKRGLLGTSLHVCLLLLLLLPRYTVVMLSEIQS